jgi:hypothetical protein
MREALTHAPLSQPMSSHRGRKHRDALQGSELIGRSNGHITPFSSYVFSTH